MIEVLGELEVILLEFVERFSERGQSLDLIGESFDNFWRIHSHRNRK